MNNSTTTIENRNDVIRDNHSKAILNTDLEGLNAWRKRKEKNNQVERNEKDINSIKNDIMEMKEMMKEITKAIKVND